jgi:hypothetical protein
LHTFLLILPGQAAGNDPPAPFLAARFLEHVAYLASDELGGRGVASAGSAKAAAYIIEQLKQSGVKPLLTDGGWYQVFPIGKITGRNVLGVVPGKGELAKEAILVSSHHDHLGTDPVLVKAGKDGIYNGADDNASGCAAMLLVAQALYADRDQLPTSCRAVIFASFDAEEMGLQGSRYYVNHPLWPLDKTAADLNFDMVGRLRGGRLLAADAASNSYLQARLAALAGNCGLKIETRLGGSRRADNASFLDREIPAVHFNTGLHSDYHQVTDESSKIDSAGGARVAWLSYLLLRDAMKEPGHLRYQRVAPEFDIELILRVIFRLGIIPELNAQEGKYPRINGIVPGSIAARYGLQSKDELSAVDATRLERIEDAALAFGRVRFDKGVQLTVLRKGKEIQVRLPPEAFKDFLGPEVKPLGHDRFELVFRYQPNGTPKSVALIGTFNNWNVTSQPMTGPDKEGYYSTRLELKQGTYEYKFVIDGKRRVNDPANIRRTGPEANSLLQLGG